MKELTISLMALALTTLSAAAEIPVTSTVNPISGPIEITRAPLLNRAKAPAGQQNTWFEGFEARPEEMGWSAQEWLPDGWQDVSKSGTTAPASSGDGWNLTWQVTTNEYITLHNPSTSQTAYEGVAFAYIMADVAYDNHTSDQFVDQDEWLITPASTPTGDDWLYFKLTYSPAWTVYNRTDNNFTGRNNSLQVYASTDDGASWTKIWDLIEDEIKTKYTDEELKANLSETGVRYRPIYVNIKQYLGKSTKFAFRYYGKMGHPMAIDNVAVGVPQPVAKYVVPAGFFYEGVTPSFEYPATPKMLIPHDTEAEWLNISTDMLTNKWTYSDAAGTVVTSTDFDLTTPAYDFGTVVDTPSLTASFETRDSDPYVLKHSRMQAGGFLTGSDETGWTGPSSVGSYDILNGNLKYIGLNLFTLGFGIDDQWEMYLGKEYEALDVLGFAVAYPAPGKPYGFDYAEIGVRIDQPVPDDSFLEMKIIGTGENDQDVILGKSRLYGKDIPENGNHMLRFDFPTAVYVNGPVIVQVGGLRGEGEGAVTFPFLYSMDPDVATASYVALSEYSSITGQTEYYGNLSTIPIEKGYFAGMIINIGATYSWMESDDDLTIDAPLEGTSKKFNVKAYVGPERWTLTTDGVTVAEWAHISNVIPDEGTGIYEVTVDIDENTLTKPRETVLRLASPGSYLPIAVRQPGAPSAIATVSGDAVSVKAVGTDIEISGAAGTACVYNVAGSLVMTAPLCGSRTIVSAAGLAPGVYVVKVNNQATTKIIL